MMTQSTRDEGSHLLRRFGLGASEAELDFYLADGYDGAVDRLVDYADIDEGYPVALERLAEPGRPVPMPLAVAWWAGRMLTTRRPLQEKMTLFWHDHFATSAAKVRGAPTMVAQNETLRANALGKFRTILTSMVNDPAMIFWLDAQENVRGRAQENLGREIMELFTLGIGHYTEKDVQEAARALTGLSFRRSQGRASAFFRAGAHDTGEKTILGKTDRFRPEELVDHLCDHPRTAEYLTTKILAWFVTPNPSPEMVAHFAKGFRESDLDVGVLVKSIMRSSDFRSAKVRRTVVKNPVDFVVATARQVGVGASLASRVATLGEGQIPRGTLGAANVASTTMKNMGMHLFFPPDVAGWDGGQAWISSATMVERMTWADRLFLPPTTTGRGARASLRWPAGPLLAGARTPDQVVAKFESVFDASLDPKIRPRVVEAAAKAMGGGLTAANTQAVAAQVSRLIFATPDFQFA